jgi:hypothetical protein
VDAYLHRPAETAAPYDDAFGTLGTTHVGEPAADLAADVD